MNKDPVELFRSAMASAGLVPPEDIHGDGKLHRFSPTGKRKDDAAWYVLHLDNLPAGSFGNWRDGFSQNWCAKADNEMTDAERIAMRNRIKALQKQREAEDERRRIVAAAKASDIWASAIPAISHPYLRSKRVKAHGLRVGKWPKWDEEAGCMRLIPDVLLVPMRDVHGKLWSLQGIDADGQKLFLPGGRVKGCYHAIGRPSARLVLGEGYATGATVHENTGDAFAVCFSSGNLEPVARALKIKYPCLTFVIAADDDWQTEGNPGMTAAKKVAAAVGALLAVPNFAGLPRGPKDTDFQDLARLAGSMRLEVQA
ncbi:toprim domain-containing protein [Polaromonas sp.]|uniref:toprim domain-containing protein n=1 Tax=Polaromonas sp. TaxID=1869339 RepID=UPI00352B7FF1